MATKVYLHTTTATPTVGTDTTLYADTGSGPKTTANASTFAIATVAGPTAPIQFTTAGNAITWLSPPIGVAVTISGTVTINIRALVDNAAANATVEGQVVRVNSSGIVLSTVVAVPPAAIPSALSTSDAAINYNATPTSTAFGVGDYIGMRIYIDDGNAVTMTSGHTVTMSLDSTQQPSVGAGDTWFQFNEGIVFQQPGVLDGYGLANLPAIRTRNTFLWPSPSANTGNITYYMRATDTTLSAVVYWTATINDSAGIQYTGPGPLTNIVRIK